MMWSDEIENGKLLGWEKGNGFEPNDIEKASWAKDFLK
jgi:hypothetical protein